MARVTVEDCLEHVDNRFELVLLATKRARQLTFGAEAMVEEENDKPTVLALREIAEGLVSKKILDEPDEPDLFIEPEKELEEVDSIAEEVRLLLAESGVEDEPAGDQEQADEQRQGEETAE